MRRLQKGEKSSQDVQSLFDHPARTAVLCQNWDFCPSGVDQIILNHHERPDGKGFPAGKGLAEMDFICSLFIIAEDFADFFIEMLGKPNMDSYLEGRRQIFKRGHFNSIFRALESSVQKKDQKVS